MIRAGRGSIRVVLLLTYFLHGFALDFPFHESRLMKTSIRGEMVITMLHSR